MLTEHHERWAGLRARRRVIGSGERQRVSDAAGNEIIVRVWNNGETINRGDEKAPLPADMEPDELTVALAEELLAKGAAGPRELGVDPETGEKVLALNGRFGPFVQLGELAEGSKKKPPRASLFSTMDPDTVTLEEALQLLSLPRVVGADDAGVEITAQNGRYGPYLKKGTDSRSLEAEEQLFTITLEGFLTTRPRTGDIRFLFFYLMLCIREILTKAKIVHYLRSDLHVLFTTT